MSAYLRQATSAFEAASRIPSLKYGRIDPVKEESRMITATWSQTSIAAGKKLAFSTVHMLEKLNDGIQSWSPGFPSPLAETDQQASNGDLRVQIQKFKGEKSEQEVLHVFRTGRLERSLNLTDLDLHGSVYFDDELGGIAINDDGSKIAYIAEAKPPKSTPFCKTSNNGVDNVESDEKEGYGQEFRYKEEFGEQMVGKSKPVIVLVNLKTSVTKFKIISDEIPQGYNPGQLTFWQDILVGLAVLDTPRKLGLVYCSNRPGIIFSLNLSQEKVIFKILSAEKKVSAKSPRVSLSGKLVWLERDLDQQNRYPGPHQAVFRLMSMDLSKPVAGPAILIDNKNWLDKIRYVGESKKEWEFRGLFEVSLPKRCYSGDEKFVIFSNIIDDTYFPLVLDIGSGITYVQKESSNNYVLDIFANDVLASNSSPLQAPRVAFASLAFKNNEPVLDFHIIGKSEELLPSFEYKTIRLNPKQSHPDPKFKTVVFSAIYVGPAKGGDKTVPLIVWPHGGPHSVISTSFINDVYFFCLLGYGVVLINFRGSIGAGEESVESILGHIGDVDVKDCQQAMSECLSIYPHLDPEAVVLFGGSHGGFLITHLAGQYPDSYKALVARNPVINVSTMATVTDIPDWNCVESGVEFDNKTPSPEIMSKMFNCSPIVHVQKVKASVFLMLGRLDLRVPPSQGYEYYHSLKFLGKKVEMNVYDDNHPLSKVPVNVNVMINSALFFQRSLQQS